MKISLATDTLWWDIAKSDPDCTYFQTPDWFKIWEKQANYRTDAYLFEFSDGTKAIFPMALERKWLGWSIWRHSSPGTNYGGVIGKEILTEGNKSSLLNWLSTQKQLILRQNPYTANAFIPCEEHSDFTQIIDLGQDEGIILEKCSKRHQRNLKKANANDLTCEIATSREDWKTYYEAYLDSTRRWGKATTRRYPWSLFEAIRASNHAKLWLVYKQGKVLYGSICFYFNHRVFYWHGAGFSKYLSLRPAHFMFHQIIHDAKTNGYKVLDLNPSGRQSGVVQFKKEMGAIKLPAPVWIQR